MNDILNQHQLGFFILVFIIWFGLGSFIVALTIHFYECYRPMDSLTVEGEREKNRMKSVSRKIIFWLGIVIGLVRAAYCVGFFNGFSD